MTENKTHIAFNRPFLTGNETKYIQEAVKSGHLSGNGKFTKLCHEFFHTHYNIPDSFLTTSCTDALEMSALLLDIKPGDEIIVPSFTFVSTANAFALRGAKIRFVDSTSHHPNMDVSAIEPLINKHTRAIVCVHYGGVACDMKALTTLAGKYNLALIEDAAQCIDAYFDNKPLGSIGDLGTFSFHETKNISSGEGGLLAVNKPSMVPNAEIIWEKGTNRSAFFRGEIEKYQWVGLGSSFLPSELTSAFLFAQLQHLEAIQKRRIQIWERYQRELTPLANEGFFEIPQLPEFATNNAHLFCLITVDKQTRTSLINFLLEKDIHAVFHYQSLHKSQYFIDQHDGRELPNSDRYSDCLLRLPLFFDLSDEDQSIIIERILEFYKKN